MVPENIAAIILDDDIDQDGEGLESTGVDPPDNNLTQSRDDNKSDIEYPKIGGGGVFFRDTDDDDDRTFY